MNTLDYNEFHIAGWVAQDPILRQSKNMDGSSYCYLRITTRLYRKKEPTSPQEKYAVRFIDLSAQFHMAERICKTLKKGMYIIVSGFIDMKPDSLKKYEIPSLVITDFTFVGSTHLQQQQPQQQQQQQPQPQAQPQPPTQPQPISERLSNLEDDFPCL